ncbi:pyridine nucleotide-disulfide oxidoreductase [Chania multitudinisentens RB-25]|uniref:Pyridine nucleotide-disulfide oxidoreductase n=1 Tax=Chania multitudinisentens RB-25 TaxID=1441930 RepID=W0L8A3_9GAMM|nr:FAD/NAD(P)-binding oxidoreductase [Chania multitudinisentens]AHG18487.1 pyridine nucleotide-disulfide oxidoreductase [Chania multitudinisentens RB-25]
MGHLQCEVLIIGAGPAGLAAACAAAESGKKIVVLDDNPHPGGQIWRDGPGVQLPAVAIGYREALHNLDNVRLLNATRVVAQYGVQQLLYESAEEHGLIDYQRLILCCGARELLLPFPGWTLPGVTGAGGLQAQIKNGLQIKGLRVAIAGSGPLLLAVANSVSKAGGEVVLLAEQASLRRVMAFTSGLWRWPIKLPQAFSLLNRRYRTSSQILAAEGTERLVSVQVRQGQQINRVACDRLACGFGLVANIELAMLLGCSIADEAVAVDRWQQTSVKQVFAAGECTGIGGSELAVLEGTIAGYAAAGNKEQAQQLMVQRDRWRRFAMAVAQAFALNPALKSLATADTLLCRCEDVKLGQLSEYADWATAKLGSRCGMGACQGRICATAARHLFGWPLPPPRIPLAPVRGETLALQYQSKTK